jgi:hypothetical protein
MILPSSVAGGAMDITKDMTFRNNSATFLRHLRKTKRALVLTVNGKAAAVVQDAEAHQQMLDLAAEARGRGHQAGS